MENIHRLSAISLQSQSLPLIGLPQINKSISFSTNSASKSSALLSVTDSTTCFVEFAKFLESYMLDVDACARVLKHHIPLLLAKNAQEVETRKKNGHLFSPSYLEMLEKIEHLIPNILTMPKEPLYYMACRIVQDRLNVLGTLRFALNPEFTKKIMEPVPYSVRYHNFIKGLRDSYPVSYSICQEEKEEEVEKEHRWNATEKFLREHLPSMVKMQRRAVFENEESNGILEADEKVEKDMEYLLGTARALKSITRNERETKMLAFRIEGSAFVNLSEVVYPQKEQKLKYVKEVYHFDETRNAQWRMEGIEREASVARYRDLRLFFHPSATSEELFISHSKLFRESEEKRIAFIASHFDTLKKELTQLIQADDCRYKISASQLFLPLRDFAEIVWAETIFEIEFPRLEYNLTKLKSMLISVPEEALYYLAHAICRETNHKEILPLVRSIHDPIFEEYSHHSPQKQYAAFISGLREKFDASYGSGADVYEFMKEHFYGILKTALDASLWKKRRRTDCISFAGDVLYYDDHLRVNPPCGHVYPLSPNYEHVLSLARILRLSSSLLEAPIIVECMMKEDRERKDEERKVKIRRVPTLSREEANMIFESIPHCHDHKRGRIKKMQYHMSDSIPQFCGGGERGNGGNV